LIELMFVRLPDKCLKKFQVVQEQNGARAISLVVLVDNYQVNRIQRLL
tara:strand:+ start:345 stop:488 length:144 start_codon:yes stop_codon:yes gene_type:complete